MSATVTGSADLQSNRVPTRGYAVALALVYVAQFVLQLDFSIVNVAGPSIQREFGLPAAQLQWLVTGYALTFGSLLLVGGRAADQADGLGDRARRAGRDAARRARDRSAGAFRKACEPGEMRPGRFELPRPVKVTRPSTLRIPWPSFRTATGTPVSSRAIDDLDLVGNAFGVTELSRTG